jgi:uncharacterized membrane protein
MRDPLNIELDRWTREGLIDKEQAARIRAFEATRGAGASWPVRLALVFGAVMVAAGVLLFVSAHWDSLSPAARFSIVVGALAAFHLAAAAADAPVARGALHAVGTIALGGAIALAGQIFNLNERWSSGILLWAIGAAIGWLLLDDEPQLGLMAMLVPAWLVAEWMIIAQRDLWWNARVFAVGLFLLALSYLTADDLVIGPRRATPLKWIGIIAFLPFGIFVWYVAQEPMAGRAAFMARSDPLSPSWAALGWSVALAAPLGVAFAVRRRGLWLNAIAAMWTLVAINLWRFTGTLALYVWFGLGAVALAAWGVRESRPERINLGTIAFALTVLAFYFSEVMDRLGRSASLVAFGVLFLVGGWILERTRRRLVSETEGGRG